MSSISSSDDVEADEEIMCCASCGKAGVDDIKLKRCNSCYLVRYCGTDCQKTHWRQHKEACKRRAAELREERLFQQPQHGDLGDCPICLLPLSNDFEKSSMQSCCYKLICNGCAYASLLHGEDGSLEDVCAFCRQPYPESEEEIWKNVMSRIEANDPVAMRQMGVKCHSEGDFRGAIEYWRKAIKLGDSEAHFQLAASYLEGKGVGRDLKKAVYHWEEAAIGGNTMARWMLGTQAMVRGMTQRAVKHFTIGAKLGCDKSLTDLKQAYAKGFVEKDDFAVALRLHHAAVDATKSPQRDAADAADQNEERPVYRQNLT